MIITIAISRYGVSDGLYQLFTYLRENRTNVACELSTHDRYVIGIVGDSVAEGVVDLKGLQTESGDTSSV